MSKHYEKTFKVGEYTFKCKKLNIFEFNSFKTLFGIALEENDHAKLQEGYKTLFGWLMYETTPGKYLPAMNPDTGDFILPALEDLDYADDVVQAMLQNVVRPLFLKSTD